MKTTAGLWIDHRDAVIAIVSTDGDKTMLIRADAGKQPERLENARTPVFSQAEQISEEHKREREFRARLNRYYDAVIATIREVESILIFGPGEAKAELKSRLELANLGGRVVALETEEKMTEREIAAEIRKYFQ